MSIPFENYLNVRAAYAPSFSPEGRRLAFLTNITGFPQAWTVDAAGGWPDQLTFGADRVSGVWYSPTDERLIFARDVGGNENMQLFLVNGDGSGETRLTAPRDDGAMHIFGGWSPDGQRITFSANRRDRGRYDIYVQAVDGSEPKMIWQNDLPGIVFPVGFSPDGARVLVFFMHSSMNQDLYELIVADRTARLLTPHSGSVRHAEPRYAADGRHVYCACDRDRDFTAMVRLDLADLNMHTVDQPNWSAAFPAVSRDGRYLAWATNAGGVDKLSLFDLHSGDTRHPPEFTPGSAHGLPAGVVSPPPDMTGLVFSPDGRALAFAFSTPTRTSDIWLWNLETNDLRPITHSSQAGIPTSALVEPELIQYPTFDGRMIPAWFFHPAPDGREKRPVVVYVHGGPEGQTTAMFFPILQYFVRRGYAVLAPNVRGSDGYGKTFLNLDNVEKRMDSVADLAQAACWLREQPGVDPARIAIYGGSYGGFMVLAALTTYPDLWAAGVDIVGISNFVTFLENTSAYRRSAREAEYGSLERDRDLLRRISPIHRVDQIRAPLMVIHGANDPRVPLGEAEQMVEALRTRNVPVEFLVYPDEGHGLVRLVNKLDAYPRVADFLDKHLAS